MEQRSVTAPNGSMKFGEISEDVANAIGVPAGEIRLQNGFQGRGGQGFGLVHLRDKPERVRQLDGIGFSSIERFVYRVAQGYTKVFKDKTEGLVLVMEHNSYHCRIVVRWNDERGFWSVTTGLPIRRSPDELLLWNGNERED